MSENILNLLKNIINLRKHLFEDILKILRNILNLRQNLFVEQVNHNKVYHEISNSMHAVARYLFMIISAIIIATVGIILNSPVVTVGAMLISPLMSPIMVLGFSFSTLDYTQLKASARIIFFGVLIAIFSAYIMVKISPIHEVNEEILSRTSPSLYDLLIAILSGIAGAYTVIHRKGGDEIIGVVLATSLIPPLAVIGFGLAVGKYDISKGAMLLFMTNLLAIAISVTLVAKWYGFGLRTSIAQTTAQFIVTMSVFISLSIPLGITLKNIAYQISARNLISSEINRYFQGDPDLNNIKVLFPHKGQIDVKAVVFTNIYQKDAQENLSAILAKKLNTKISLIMQQVQSKVSGAKTDISLLSQKELVEQIKQAMLFPIRNIEIDQNSRIIEVYPAIDRSSDIGLLYEAEQKAQEQFPGWRIKVYPQILHIPAIYFGINKAILSEQEEYKLKAIAWMLGNWDIKKVTVTGFTDSANSDIKSTVNSLIKRRVEYISDKLKEKEISATLILAKSPPEEYDKEVNYYGVPITQRVIISSSLD